MRPAAFFNIAVAKANGHIVDELCNLKAFQITMATVYWKEMFAVHDHVANGFHEKHVSTFSATASCNITVSPLFIAQHLHSPCFSVRYFQYFIGMLDF